MGGRRVDLRDALRPLAVRVQEPNGDVQEDHKTRPRYSEVSLFSLFSQQEKNHHYLFHHFVSFLSLCLSLTLHRDFEPELQSLIDGFLQARERSIYLTQTRQFHSFPNRSVAMFLTLQVDLTRRLGNMHAGTDDIKSHAYFNGYADSPI